MVSPVQFGAVYRLSPKLSAVMDGLQESSCRIYGELFGGHKNESELLTDYVGAQLGGFLAGATRNDYFIPRADQNGWEMKDMMFFRPEEVGNDNNREQSCVWVVTNEHTSDLDHLARLVGEDGENEDGFLQFSRNSSILERVQDIGFESEE